MRLIAAGALMCCLVWATVAAALAQTDEVIPPPATELVALKVEKAPPLRAEAGDAWAKASELEIRVDGGNQNGVNLTLRALYDAENLYVLAQWADPTRSDVKAAWEFKDGQWTRLKGDEDRLSLAFNISSADFAEKGCAGVCHGTDEKKMHCVKEGELVDLWHWKAARGGQSGWCDDQCINSAKRGDDKGKACYIKNENPKDAKQPGWRWSDKADKSGLFDEGSAVAIDESYKPAEGEVIPSHVMRKAEGSRADVTAWAKHNGKSWTVLLVRKLDTGNADDVRFVPGEKVPFAAALMDDCGTSIGDEHAKSRMFQLHLKK